MAQSYVEIVHSREFSAAHKLESPHLDQAANRELYGPCYRDHGHNYVLEVCVRGAVDPRTGMVMDLNRLSRIIVERVIDRVDHRHLNHDVPFLAGTITTAENVAIAFWREIEPHLRAYPGCTLHRIRLHESSANKVDYYGPNPARSRASSKGSSKRSAKTRRARA